MSCHSRHTVLILTLEVPRIEQHAYMYVWLCRWHCACWWPCIVALWRHQMETFTALLDLCAGNLPVTGEFPAQRPVTRNFDVFFDLRLNKWLNEQSRRRWFETPSRSLGRHRNGTYVGTVVIKFRPSIYTGLPLQALQIVETHSCCMTRTKEVIYLFVHDWLTPWLHYFHSTVNQLHN